MSVYHYNKNKMELIITAVTNQEDYLEQFEMIDQLIKEDSTNNSKKPQTVKLLQCLNDILTSEDYQPKVKYYSIVMAKDFALKKYSVFVSCLASSILLQSMTKMAKSIDPKKQVSQKGLTLFPDRALGNKLMTLIIQCIVKWSQKYPISNKTSGQPTKFRLAYNQLLNEGVKLPKQFIYFPNTGMVASGGPPERKNKQQSQKRSISQRNNPKDVNKNLKLSLNKINGFLSFLRQCDDRDEAEREINRYHKMFQSESKQYDQISNQVIDEGLLDDDWRVVMFLMMEFYTNQNNLYVVFLQKDKDIKSYISKVFDATQHLYTKLEQTNTPQEIPSPRRNQDQSIIRKSSDVVAKSVGIKYEIGQKKTQILPKVIQVFHRQSSQSEALEKLKRDLSIGYRGDYIPDRNVLNLQESENKNQNKQFSEEAEQGAMMIKQIFRQNHQPHSSFYQFRKDLEKERSFKSKNLIQKSKSVRRGKDISRSQDRKALYNNDREQFAALTPTNLSRVSIYNLHPKVVNDQYSGQIIQTKCNYSYQLQEINTNQSLKRFKVCAFRQRYLLFQNEVFQIGFQSSPLYRQHPKYQSLLNITVFIGNKTQDEASEVVASFQGDKTNAVYASPLKIPKLIDGGMQIKQNLLVVPLQIPFNLINFKLKYSYKGNYYRVNVFLPYMVNKFAVYEYIETSSFIENYERSINNQIRTNVFTLSKRIPPPLLLKYIPNIIQISSYRNFLKQTSYSQYKLGIKILLLNKYYCLIKVIIRPDMTAVIQGVYGGDDSSKQFCSSFISTLQFILTDNDSFGQ